jgi:DNA (cytosine-5)-methyltransferase 1
MTTAYYNENDPYCAAWLRNLIERNLIAPGDVDDRSVLDVRPKDLRNYAQCHFFAGLGGWSRALRLAHVRDDRPIWTGSCPCQPFSQAGKGLGFADERHLWPYWFHLIEQCRPAVLFGEQVASGAGREWLARVHVDLEASGYAFGAADLCAAGTAAPHCRQRHFFVAHVEREWVRGTRSEAFVRASCGVQGADEERQWVRPDARPAGLFDGLGNANGREQFWWSGSLQVGWNAIESFVERGGRRYRAQWRIKPGVPIVAHGVPARVAKLRALGNAIVPQVAAEFILAALDLSCPA